MQALGIECKTVIHGRNRGTAPALNSGIQVTHTEWILPLASDDMLMPNAIQEWKARRDTADAIPFAYQAFGHRSNGVPIDNRGGRHIRRYTKHRDYVAAFRAGKRISSGASPFRRVFWERYGFNEEMKKSEDTAFWVKIAQAGARFSPTVNPCKLRRGHGRRKSYDHSGRYPERDERVRMIRKYLAMPEPVDFFATEKHFIDHLAPLWLALRSPLRGFFLVPHYLYDYAEALGVRAVSYREDHRRAARKYLRHGSGLVVTAASSNQLYVSEAHRESVYCEHGSGQTYKRYHSSYAGWKGRKGIKLFLVPGPVPGRVNRAAYPGVPVAEIGSPRLDPWHDGSRQPEVKEKPVVCISFHWDCPVVPETSSGWDFFKGALPALARAQDFKLIGHGHPRLFNSRKGEVEKEYKRLGIEVVRDFEEVMYRAGCYVIDNSSTLFEFASTGRPVVLMNPPAYRRTVNHGMRFWEMAQLGPNADRPENLLPAIRKALREDEAGREARMKLLEGVYTHMDGTAARRGADAITKAAWRASRPAIPEVSIQPTKEDKMEWVRMRATATFSNRKHIKNLTDPSLGHHVRAGHRFLMLDRTYARDLIRKKLAVELPSKKTGPAEEKKEQAPGSGKAPGEAQDKAQEPDLGQGYVEPEEEPEGPEEALEEPQEPEEAPEGPEPVAVAEKRGSWYIMTDGTRCQGKKQMEAYLQMING